MPRSIWFVLSIFMLFDTTQSYAESSAQPIPADGKCSVSPDKTWTRQERFVWQKVCVGEDANFNKAPGYGDELDPRVDVLPDKRILRSSFIETILLKERYRRALTRLGVRIIGARFTEVIDLEGAELKHDLFLKSSLFHKGANFRKVKSTHSINLDGSNIVGSLDMQEMRVNGGLSISNQALLLSVTLVNSHVDADVTLDDSTVTETLNMGGVRIGSNFLAARADIYDLSLVNGHVGNTVSLTDSTFSRSLDMGGVSIGATFQLIQSKFESVNLTNAHVRGNLELVRATFSGTLDMTAIQIGTHLLSDSARFRDLRLTNSRVAGDLSLTDSLGIGGLHIDAAQVGGTILMHRASLMRVDLSNTHVGENLEMENANVLGMLDLRSIHVGANMLNRHATFFTVTSANARVGGDLDLGDATVIGTLDMAGLNLSGNLLMSRATVLGAVTITGGRAHGVFLDGSKLKDALDISGLRIDRDLSMRTELDTIGIQVGDGLYARNSAEFDKVSMESAVIGGYVLFIGATVAGAINCVNASVGRDFLLNEGAFFDLIDLRLAQIKGNLDLAAGTFMKPINLTGGLVGGGLGLGVDLSGAIWLDEARLILRNARADIIPSLADAWPDKLDLDGFNYRSVKAADSFEQWFAKLDPYASQPYTQLSSVVQSQGKNELATDIRYAGRDRERHESSWGWWIWLTFLWGSIGYGYYLYRALIWVVILVATGAFLLWRSDQSWRNGLRSWPDKIIFSFDMLMPIIKLREKHYEIDLKGRLGYYFYLHKILGYVLASFLIAGLSGLTK